MGEIREFLDEANDALQASILSIADDPSMSLTAKQAAVAESIGQYKEYVGPAVVKIAKAAANAAADAVATVNHRTVTIATPVNPAPTFSPADVFALACRVNALDLTPEQLATLGDGDLFLTELQRRAEESRQEGETEAQAFTRCATLTPDGIALMAANRKLARPSVQKAAYRSSIVTVGKADAYASLEAKAAELRKSEPALTEAQAFAKVFADPANRKLAAASLGKAAPAEPELSDLDKPSMTPSLRALYGMADDMRAKNPKLTEAAAFARAMTSPQGVKLYRQYKSELNQGAHQ